MHASGQAVDTARSLATMVGIPIPPEPAMPPRLPPHVRAVRNPTGRLYYYLILHRGTHRQQRSVRLPDDPSSPEFWTAYAEHMRLPRPQESTNAVAALIAAWQRSPEWRQMTERTREEWGRHCRRIGAAWGRLEVRGIAPRHVLELRDAWADTPATANNLLRCLSSMLGWSVPRGWRADNPCREVPKLRGGDGYPPWPWEAIASARDELAAGRVDLWWAVALALYTGQRLGDVLGMKWSALAGGRVTVRQDKTRKLLTITVHRELAALLETVPRRAVTILTSSEGRPWTADGFQASWRKHKPAAARAGGLVFHGLRKSAVVTLLEAGCSDAEAAAITGQSRQMIEHYARLVNQERLAAAAILKWETRG